MCLGGAGRGECFVFVVVLLLLSYCIRLVGDSAYTVRLHSNRLFLFRPPEIFSTRLQYVSVFHGGVRCVGFLNRSVCAAEIFLSAFRRKQLFGGCLAACQVVCVCFFLHDVDVRCPLLGFSCSLGE